MSWSDEVTGTQLDLSQAPAELGWAGTMLERFLADVSYGHIKIVLPSGRVINKQGVHPGPEAIILIRNWRMLRRVIAAGDIGFAEGFIEGDWTTPDLMAVIRFAAKNGKALAPAIEGGFLMRVVNRMKHLFRANTKRGSRKNIESYYDLGNHFYALWLDPSMLYSSVMFDETTRTLEEAQNRKLGGIAEKLELAGGETIDLTNQAILIRWSTVSTIADLCWGTFLSAIASGAGYWITTRLFGGSTSGGHGL